ncbi:MAG TPA: hypothetical protein ENJ82_02425 [Bacteroidetes bacterium]|nr:hypothetical protein [Bacteroidota bacterium]
MYTHFTRFTWGAGLFLFFTMLIGCKSAQENVQVMAGLQRVQPCGGSAPADFQAALGAMNFTAAAGFAKSEAERLVLVRAEGLVMGGQIPSEFSVSGMPESASSHLRWQANVIAQADAWLRGDFGRVVELSQLPDGKNSAPSTVGISAALAASPRRQSLDFRQNQFMVPLYENKSHNPLIDVRINGQSFRFWLDTGAGVSVISSAVAAKAGIFSAGNSDKKLNSSTKRVVKVGMAYIDSLAFGELMVYNHPCAILAKQDLIIRFLGMPLIKIDGIIGWPLLQALDLEFDLPNGALTVRKPKVRAVSRKDLGWFWQPVMRLRTANGCALHLHLDTGSGSTFFHPSAYAKLNLHPRKGGKLMRGGAGGKEVVHYDRLDSCRFFVGNHLMLMAEAEGIAGKRDAADLFELDGVIGQDILSLGKFRIDFTNRFYAFELASP